MTDGTPRVHRVSCGCIGRLGVDLAACGARAAVATGEKRIALHNRQIRLGFEVVSLGLGRITGHFNVASGVLTFNSNEPSKSSFKVVAQTASITTASPSMDAQLNTIRNILRCRSLPDHDVCEHRHCACGPKFRYRHRQPQDARDHAACQTDLPFARPTTGRAARRTDIERQVPSERRRAALGVGHERTDSRDQR